MPDHLTILSDGNRQWDPALNQAEGLGSISNSALYIVNPKSFQIASPQWPSAVRWRRLAYGSEPALWRARTD